MPLHAEAHDALRHTAHALRHTFCTMLAERGVALEVIRELSIVARGHRRQAEVLTARSRYRKARALL